MNAKHEGRKRRRKSHEQEEEKIGNAVGKLVLSKLLFSSYSSDMDERKLLLFSLIFSWILVSTSSSLSRDSTGFLSYSFPGWSSPSSSSTLYLSSGKKLTFSFSYLQFVTHASISAIHPQYQSEMSEEAGKETWGREEFLKLKLKLKILFLDFLPRECFLVTFNSSICPVRVRSNVKVTKSESE